MRTVIDTLRNNRTMSALLASATACVAALMMFGGPSTNDIRCRPPSNPTAEKTVAPSELVTVSGGQVLTVNYGYSRGTQQDETELTMKGAADTDSLPSGPIAVSHSLLKRVDGPTSYIVDSAINVSAHASGSRLRVRICVDTLEHDSVLPGRYAGIVAIEDGRFEGHEGIPVEVTLQTQYIWWLGAPLTGAVLVTGVWFASKAADQSLLALESKVAVTLFVLAVAAAAQTFRTNVLADQAFGYDPIVQWTTLVWAVGSAVLAAATGTFGTEKFARAGRDTSEDSTAKGRPAQTVNAAR